MFLSAALFVTAFVGTLLLSISVTKESRNPDPGIVDAAAGGAAVTPAVQIEEAGDAVAIEDILLPDADLEDRRWAISALAAEPSPESVEALEQVITSSGDYRERLDAVEALRQIAGAPQTAAEVRQVLQLATRDRHPDVAARARASLAGG